MIKPTADAGAASPGVPWTAARRFWVSIFLIFHLFCVALAPLAVVEPRPGLAVALQGWLRPYSESLYLIHGYRFFAPEPGPSHILHYEITRNSGETLVGHFPDRNQHWPRLLYHRWFMLSETVFQHVSATLNITELDRWQQEVQQQIEALQESDPRAANRLQADLRRELSEHERMSQIRDQLVIRIGKNLLRKFQGETVDLKLVTRVIPRPQDVEIGLQLDHPRYTPPELTYTLGTVFADSDELELIVPQEENAASSDGQQGRGGTPR